MGVEYKQYLRVINRVVVFLKWMVDKEIQVLLILLLQLVVVEELDGILPMVVEERVEMEEQVVVDLVMRELSVLVEKVQM